MKCLQKELNLLWFAFESLQEVLKFLWMAFEILHKVSKFLWVASVVFIERFGKYAGFCGQLWKSYEQHCRRHNEHITAWLAPIWGGTLIADVFTCLDSKLGGVFDQWDSRVREVRDASKIRVKWATRDRNPADTLTHCMASGPFNAMVRAINAQLRFSRDLDGQGGVWVCQYSDHQGHTAPRPGGNTLDARSTLARAPRPTHRPGQSAAYR